MVRGERDPPQFHMGTSCLGLPKISILMGYLFPDTLQGEMERGREKEREREPLSGFIQVKTSSMPHITLLHDVRDTKTSLYKRKSKQFVSYTSV